jgi:hypothetical protein
MESVEVGLYLIIKQRSMRFFDCGTHRPKAGIQKLKNSGKHPEAKNPGPQVSFLRPGSSIIQRLRLGKQTNPPAANTASARPQGFCR